jgi:hypothetical protein
MTKDIATDLIHKFQIRTDKDFYTLSSAEVHRVLEAADDRKYRKPKNANGSRARYFFAALKRATNRKA